MKIVAALIAFALASPTASAQELLLFGGRNNETFIGCLNCSKYDSGSICNRYGDYGSKYSDTSIWSRYGTYGSKYNEESPWNKYSSNPPAVVDRNGGFYGYFTANRYESKRTTIPSLLFLTDNVDLVVEDLERARDIYCRE
ncbi:MAG: hypothetical protein ACRD1R_13035 [Acidobacteriota bacterium]